MYIQAFLQKNCDPFRNAPSVSLSRLLQSILHKRRRKKREHHNTRPLPPAVKAKSFPQAVAHREEGEDKEQEREQQGELY